MYILDEISGAVLLIVLVAVIIHLINVWHLVITDSKNFEGGIENKKRWYFIFNILPLVLLILEINIIVGIAYVIFNLYYFFVIRVHKKKRTKKAQ